MIRKFYIVYKVKSDVVQIFKNTIDKGITELEEIVSILQPHLPKYHLVAHHMRLDHHFCHSLRDIHNGTILATQSEITFAEYYPWVAETRFRCLKACKVAGLEGDDWFLIIPDPSIPDQVCKDPHY